MITVHVLPHYEGSWVAISFLEADQDFISQVLEYAEGHETHEGCWCVPELYKQCPVCGGAGEDGSCAGCEDGHVDATLEDVLSEEIGVAVRHHRFA